MLSSIERVTDCSAGWIPRSLATCALCAALVLGGACVELPEPPRTEDLSGLAQSYDEPTARLPEDVTQELLQVARPYLDVARRLDGLSLIQTTVAEASAALDSSIDLGSVTIQGSVRAQLSCPGHEAIATDDSARNGVIDVTMGVEETRIQRGLEGAAVDCEFVAVRFGEMDEVTFSADFVADLGETLAIGDEPSTLLTVRLSDLEVMSELTDDALAIPNDGYDFRVTEEQSIEVLLDPRVIGLRNLGTIVLISHLDGSIGLRERRGEWRCPSGGGCTLRRSTR
jgi:hypothetical protein